MRTKLTLRIEDRLIRRAKKLARKRGKSVSELVSGYFEALDEDRDGADEDLPPVTRKLHGALRGAEIELEEYRRHLAEKYR